MVVAQACNDDTDCQRGTECVGGLCRLPCEFSKDCPTNDLRCDPDIGYCTDEDGGECDSNKDCDDRGNVCRAGVCTCNGKPICNGGRVCEAEGCVCPPPKKQCGYACIHEDLCCTDADCEGGYQCIDGECVCPPGQVLCQGQCIPDGTGCCIDSDCGDTTCGTCDPVSGLCACDEPCRLCDNACLTADQCCTDADCPGNLSCVNNACICEGECCAEAGTEIACDDGIDNDCDGATDCADTDDCRAGDPCDDNGGVCAGAGTCCTATEGVCNDGIDNDCDGATDCDDDQSECPTDELACDGQDDDCDGVVDEGVTNTCTDYQSLGCSTYETCGGCASPPAEVCDDQEDDDCDAAVDCADAECAGQPCGPNSCEGLLLTAWVCSGTGCEAQTIENCDDGNPCTDDACDPSGGCTHTDNYAPCTADACHGAGTCDGGVCLAGAPIDCSDGNGCTSDSCDPHSGCVYENISGSCDDGDACTQTDTCQAGTCLGSNPVVCSASDQCHGPGICNPGTGLCSNPPKEDGSACDDGDACTQLDVCLAGSCEGSDPVLCSATDQCHDTGACDPNTGLCSNPVRPDGAVCDDGNPCTTGDACGSGACSGAPKTCDDSNVCTDDSCNASTGQCINSQIAACESCSVATDCSAYNGVCTTAECIGSRCRDANRASGTACGGSNADCDAYDTCDGAGNCVDNVKPSTTQCRADQGDCDVPEYCDGSSKLCPTNGFEPAGEWCSVPYNPGSCTTECNGSGGCDVANLCGCIQATYADSTPYRGFTPTTSGRICPYWLDVNVGFAPELIGQQNYNIYLSWTDDDGVAHDRVLFLENTANPYNETLNSGQIVYFYKDNNLKNRTVSWWVEFEDSICGTWWDQTNATQGGPGAFSFTFDDCDSTYGAAYGF